MKRFSTVYLLLCCMLCTADDGSEYDANDASIQDLPSNAASSTPSWQRPSAKARWGAPTDPRRAAWVVVVSNDNLTRHYYDLLLANLECLRQTNSKYEVALLYEGELDEETQTAVKALNVSKVYNKRGLWLANNTPTVHSFSTTRITLSKKVLTFQHWRKRAPPPVKTGTCGTRVGTNSQLGRCPGTCSARCHGN